MYSNKIDLDKFYTKKDVVLKCIKYINFSLYDFVIEPSAGNGSFYNQIKHNNKIGLDLKPESSDIICNDWLDYKIDNQYEKVLILGNPPFGIRNALSKKFLQHSCSFTNVYTIAFILPNVYNKHTLQKYVSSEFRLKNIIKLDDNAFLINNEPYHVPCSFFIFDKSKGECLRFSPELYKETNDWQYGDKNNYDFFIMGASINTVKESPTKNNRGYYIKVKKGIDIEKVKNKFKNLKAELFSSVNGGVAWMTKPELVKNYVKSMQDMRLYNKACFDVFPKLEDSSVDMVCVDPPYGTTSIEWDNVLDFSKMWEELNRIVKPNGNVIIFGSQPFTSLVICSNLKSFRYELVWNKNKCGSPGLAKIRPQKVHENIMVFSRKTGGTYNPVMEEGEAYKRETTNPEGYGSGRNTHGYGFGKNKFMKNENKGTRCPKSILHASRNFSAQQTVHPTQKPTNLLNWLLFTYSNPNDVVLDFTMGSGSCGVSAKLTGRKFIGIELDKEYFEIAKQRIEETETNVVSPADHQLTTQISKDMETTSKKKQEEKAEITVEDFFQYG